VGNCHARLDPRDGTGRREVAGDAGGRVWRGACGEPRDTLWRAPAHATTSLSPGPREG
jgi:hypothetical protein